MHMHRISRARDWGSFFILFDREEGYLFKASEEMEGQRWAF